MANSVFEQIKRIDENQREIWSARDLAKVLEYSEYRHFLPVIERAKDACRNSGEVIHTHFEDVLEMVKIGSGAERTIDTIYLDRYACYLIVQNSDPSKEVVALGQTYFAIQTRRQEISDQRIEDKKRLHLREEIKKHNISLAEAASGAGVEDHAKFHNSGYKGLYGGLGVKDIHERKNLKKSQKILDHMGSEELAANLFRATQTDAKLRREKIQGETNANLTHYAVGQKVRQTIAELGGTMPEELPVTDSIAKAKIRIKKSSRENQIQQKNIAYANKYAKFVENEERKSLIVTLPYNATSEMIHRLSQFFNNCESGHVNVFLYHQSNKLETPFEVVDNLEILEGIKQAIEG